MAVTHDEAARIVRADLIEHLAARDMAEIAGFPADNTRLLEAARLRMAQERVGNELRFANGEPVTALTAGRGANRRAG